MVSEFVFQKKRQKEQAHLGVGRSHGDFNVRTVLRRVVLKWLTVGNGSYMFAPSFRTTYTGMQKVQCTIMWQLDVGSHRNRVSLRKEKLCWAP